MEGGGEIFSFYFGVCVMELLMGADVGWIAPFSQRGHKSDAARKVVIKNGSQLETTRAPLCVCRDAKKLNQVGGLYTQVQQVERKKEGLHLHSAGRNGSKSQHLSTTRDGVKYIYIYILDLYTNIKGEEYE